MDFDTRKNLLVLAPAKLLSVNEERRLHWSKRADAVSLWRFAAKVDAKNARLPRFKSVFISASIHQAKGTLADAGNYYPVVKACIDGLVDAGVIENDDPSIVHAVNQLASIRADRDAVLLYLSGEAA